MSSSSSLITPWIVQHEALLSINFNSDKIQEDDALLFLMLLMAVEKDKWFKYS